MNTVVQTENDFFEPEIQSNSPISGIGQLSKLKCRLIVKDVIFN